MLANQRSSFGPYRSNPFWALFGIAIGTVSAALLVPDILRSYSADLIPSGLAMTAGLLFGPLVSGLHSHRSLFRVEHLLMVGLVFWLILDAAQGAYITGVSRSAMQAAFWTTGVFATFLWLGSGAAELSIGMRSAPVYSPDLGAQFLFWSGVASFVLGMARPFLTCQLNPVCVYDGFFAPRFEVPWFHGPGLGNWDTFTQQLHYFGFLIPALTAALLKVERRISRRGMVLAVLSCLFLLLVIRDGGRRSVGMIIGAAGLLWMLLTPRLRLRHFVIIGLLAGLMLWLMQAMLAWRLAGFGTALLEGQSTEISGRSGVSVDNNLQMLGHILMLVPETRPHTGMTGILYIVGTPIPGSVWPGKPVARGFPDLPRLVGMHVNRGYSWTCSVIGDLYLIGGYLALAVGGLLYGGIANMCSRLLLHAPTVRNRLVFAVGAMTLFVSFRAVHEILGVGFAFFAIWGLLIARRSLLRRRLDPALGVSTLPRGAWQNRPDAP